MSKERTQTTAAHVLHITPGAPPVRPRAMGVANTTAGVTLMPAEVTMLPNESAQIGPSHTLPARSFLRRLSNGSDASS